MSRFTLAACTLIAILIAGVVYLRVHRTAVSVHTAQVAARVGCSEASSAYRDHENDVWLTVQGRVTRLLPDSVGQYRHQRFIVRCPSALTVLIVNDVSIGQRVPVRLDASVAAHGQYVWNAEGGLIHFTHHDPSGGRGGWILYQGHIYS